MNANCSLTYGAYQAPQGTVVASILLTLKGSNAANFYSQQLSPGTTSASFSSPASDTYTLSAQAQDSSGNAIGPAATQSGISITQPTSTVSVQIPTAVSCTVA